MGVEEFERVPGSWHKNSRILTCEVQGGSTIISK